MSPVARIVHHIDEAFPESLWSGPGTTLLIRGWCFLPDYDITAIAVVIDGLPPASAVIKRARPDVRNDYRGGPALEARSLASGFYAMVDVPPNFTGNRGVHLLINSGAASHRLDIRPIVFTAAPPLAPDPCPAPPLVAVCLASYRPSLPYLQRQLGSITKQTMRDFICYVNEDTADYPTAELVRQVVGDDPRFIVANNAKNLGFYGNFERVMQRVPVGVTYVTLADQDDAWLPDKLERMVAAMRKNDCDLAYSDMRIVDGEGKMLAPSYWGWRRNHWDFEQLFFANTVTGAASMFRRDLLDRVLPFPVRIGDIYHDWWLAINAAAGRGIHYIPDALYDYYQHGSNVIGFFDGRRQEPWVSLAHQVKYGTGVYDNELLRLALSARVMLIRSPRSPRLVRQAARTWATGLAPSLFWYALKGKLRHRHTLGAEKRLALSRIYRLLFDRYHRFEGWPKNLARHLLKPRPGAVATVPANATPESLMQVAAMEKKIAPFPVVLSEREPLRVNLLLSVVDFAILFGGYLGMFHFAEALMRRGFKVRVITVDPCDFKPDTWRIQARKYLSLSGVFANLEFLDGSQRPPVVVNPGDRWAATSWWTAHIAASAVRAMPGRQPFVYLIQDYEPVFYNHSSFHALAEQSYRLPHFAVFSTTQLRDFFRLNGKGVFDRENGGDSARHIFFENAIVPVAADAAAMRIRRGRKLLFYLRPEAHAARNLFELGYIALRRCIREGVFSGGPTWEFHGIGTASLGATVPLADRCTMTVLPKMDLDEYVKRLPEYDLGISLMLTPHPSLVPIEMCAAGLAVVTTAYANKTADSLRSISGNFHVAEASVDGIMDAIKRAVAAVEDIDGRIACSKVTWPMSWPESFHDAIMDPLEKELRQNQNRPAVAIAQK